MPFAAAIPLAISGISALAGMFGNKKQQQKAYTDSTTTQNINQLSMPEYDEKTRQMRDQLMHAYLDPLGEDQDFSGYEAEGLSNINRGADASDRAIANILASRGLGGTSAGISSRIGNLLSRGQQASSFLNSIPQLREQQRAARLGQAGQFFSALPTGTRQTGTNVSRQQGTQTQEIPGNMLGGGLTGLGTSLAYMYGRGAFGGKTPVNTGTPTFAGDPNSALDPYESNNFIRNVSPYQFNSSNFSLYPR